jgi:cAMP-dependent protein kinase regulator
MTASNSTLGSAFSAPFGTTAQATGPPARDASPFGENGHTFNQSPFGAAPTFGAGPASSEDQQDEPVIPSYALGRRTSVSAESLVPANQRTFPPSGHLESTMEEDEDTPNPNNAAMPSFPKTEEQLARIRAAIKPNFLFRNLDDEQEIDVLAAMKEVIISPGEMIIEQGAAGDFFYVVESGTLEVFVKREGQVLDPEKGDKPALGRKVATCVEGNSFGELALMHKWVLSR